MLLIYISRVPDKTEYPAFFFYHSNEIIVSSILLFCPLSLLSSSLELSLCVNFSSLFCKSGCFSSEIFLLVNSTQLFQCTDNTYNILFYTCWRCFIFRCHCINYFLFKMSSLRISSTKLIFSFSVPDSKNLLFNFIFLINPFLKNKNYDEYFNETGYPKTRYPAKIPK